MPEPDRHHNRWRAHWLGLSIVLTAALALAQTSSPGPALLPPEIDVTSIVERFRNRPHIVAQYDYIMSARVRLLLFWVGRDDVGAGYIRRGISTENDVETIELLMGSDPKKAPRAINRWGAASELFEKVGSGLKTSTFFGFMKTSKGASPGEMEKELAQEKASQKAFLFSAIIDQATPDGEFVKVLPFESDTDLTIHDLDRIVPVVLDRLAGPAGLLKTIDASRRKSGGCVGGFLSSVSNLVDAAMAAPRERVSSCYLYNGEQHRVNLVRAKPVPQEVVELSLFQPPQKYGRTYHDLVLAQIENVNEVTKKRSSFQLLLGTKGDLNGVPVRITYQPNWWFQVILNLRTPD